MVGNLGVDNLMVGNLGVNNLMVGNFECRHFFHPGPWSDQGRKPIMALPFVGHIISGVFYFLFLHYEQWPGETFLTT
jgi:hypothetical protein